MTIRFNPKVIPSNFIASVVNSDVSKAIFEILIRLNINGNISGKLNIAIKAKLLSDREAIAATIVRVEANPKAPNISPAKNKAFPTIILPKNS